MLFDILAAKIGFVKKARLMLRLISIYYMYVYGIVSLLLLAFLFYMVYLGGGLSQFINYYFFSTYNKLVGLVVFLLIIISMLKYIFDSKTEMFYEGLGDIYFDLIKKDYAEKAYKESLMHNPNREYALRRLGDLGVSLSDYDLAIKYYQKSLKINNKLFLSWKGLGDIYSIQSKTSGAIDAYVEALKINSLHEIKLKLALLCKTEGESYINQQLYDKAIDSIKQSVENNPSLDASWTLLGGLYALIGNHDLAVNAFERAIKLNPSALLKDKLFTSLLIIGQQCYGARDLKRSEDAFQRATEVNPQSATAWAYLGDVSFKQGKIKEAERDYRNAISIDPNSASSWISLGNVLAQQNRFEAAEEAYQKAISLDPNMASTHIGMGNVLAQQGKFIEAEKAYRKAISINPNLASSWVGLGNVLAQQNRFEAAEEAYQMAISLNPNLTSSWIGLGNVLAQQQRYHESLKAFDKAIECDANEEPKLKVIRDSVNLRIQLENLFSSILIEEKNNVALLLDTSSSMQGQKISDAKEVIIKAVRSIPTKHNAINLIFFGASIYAYSLEPNDLLKSRDDLINRINQTDADGNTPLLGALKRAWEFLKSRENRIIIIVTDGMPNDALPDVILDYAKSLKDAGCKMNSLGIGKGTEINEDFLRKIASRKEDFHFVDVDLNSKSAPYVYVSVYQPESPK